MKTIRNHVMFKGAFQCHKCPGNNDPNTGRACPAWMVTHGTNLVTQEAELLEQCGWSSLQRWMEHIAQSSNQAAASADKATNAVVTAFAQIPLARIELKEPPNAEGNGQASIEGPSGE